MKIIPRLLLVSFFLVAMISPQEALAGSCNSTGCGVASVAPAAQRKPATNSASHAFTAAGGSRVAEHNLSPEARDVISAAGKEAPLPKGWVTAEDRVKLNARQAALDGWADDAVARPVSRAQSRSSIAARASRKSRAKALPSPTGPGKPVVAVKVASAAKMKSHN